MIANLYIISESFIQNSFFSKEEIEERIELLAQDYSYIRLYKDNNRLYVNYNIYNIPFLNSLSIQELLYDKDKKEYLDRDARNALAQIIEMSEETTLNFDQIKELLSIVNENLCHGVIAFNELTEIDSENQIIYNTKKWLEFRRHYLSQYPKDPNYFIEECKIYFPKLFFHENNKVAIKSILSDCSIKIIYHLTALNDNFKNSQERSLANGETNRQQVLENFSRENRLDEIASLEVYPKRKNEMSFFFLKEDTNTKTKICCEPHIKLPFKDKDDGSYSTNRRIYFHEGVKYIAEGRVLIGHIGNHL